MTARIITETCLLPGPPDLVWDLVRRPETLLHISKGRVRFQPVDLQDWPEIWRDGAYRTRMWGPLGLPLGQQIIRISYPPPQGDTRFLRDRGEGQLVRVWDHLVSVAPEGEATRYRDEVRIEAGVLTPVIAVFARDFYRHRQKRLVELVDRRSGDRD